MDARASYCAIRDVLCDQWKWRRLRNPYGPSWPIETGEDTGVWDLSGHDWNGARVYWLWSDEYGRGHMRIVWDDGRVLIRWVGNQQKIIGQDEHLVEAVLRGWLI